MKEGFLDELLWIGASFDWITPLNDLIAGYNTIEVDETIAYDYCKQVERELTEQGVKCRTQFTGDGWRVISKR